MLMTTLKDASLGRVSWKQRDGFVFVMYVCYLRNQKKKKRSQSFSFFVQVSVRLLKLNVIVWHLPPDPWRTFRYELKLILKVVSSSGQTVIRGSEIVPPYWQLWIDNALPRRSAVDSDVTFIKAPSPQRLQTSCLTAKQWTTKRAGSLMCVCKR